MEYMIYLTDGDAGTCITINSDEIKGRELLNIMAKTMHLNDAWLELREYPNPDTDDYTVIDKRPDKPNVYPIWMSNGEIVGTFVTSMSPDDFGAEFHEFQSNKNGGVPTKDADPSEFCEPMRNKAHRIDYYPNTGHDHQWWIQER